MIFQHFGVLLPYTSIIIPTLKKAQFFFKESDFFSALVKTALIRCYEAWDSYYRLNVTNSNLHRENEGLRKTNEKLAGENENLRAENKDYKLLRKAFGSKQIDNLLEQAKVAQKSKQRGNHFKNNKEER